MACSSPPGQAHFTCWWALLGLHMGPRREGPVPPVMGDEEILLGVSPQGTLGAAPCRVIQGQ